MNTEATASNPAVLTGTTQASPIHRSATYQKVLDGRKRPIRGLWIRNERDYARLAVADPNRGAKSVRRVPLPKATTVAQAVAEMRRLQTLREDNDLPVLEQTLPVHAHVVAFRRVPVSLLDSKPCDGASLKVRPAR